MTSRGESLGTDDFLDQENQSRLISSLLEIFGRYGLHDVGRIGDTHFGFHPLFPGLLLQLHVEEPFVDLDTGQTGLAHGFLAHFAVPLAVQAEEQLAQVVHLGRGLLLAPHVVLDHVCRRAHFHLAWLRLDRLRRRGLRLSHRQFGALLE